MAGTFPDPCAPFDAAMRLLDRRWAAAVVRAMLDGAGRFGEIRAGVPGITDAVLSGRLRELCTWGLAVKEPDPERPGQSHYRLTDAGCDLAPVLAAVEAYGVRHGAMLGEIPRGRGDSS